MEIILPKISTIANADKIINDCVKAQKCSDPLTFNFTETTFIDPFAITIIAGTIHCCLGTKRTQIGYIPPEEKIKN